MNSSPSAAAIIFSLPFSPLQICQVSFHIPCKDTAGRGRSYSRPYLHRTALTAVPGDGPPAPRPSIPTEDGGNGEMCCGVCEPRAEFASPGRAARGGSQLPPPLLPFRPSWSAFAFGAAQYSRTVPVAVAVSADECPCIFPPEGPHRPSPAGGHRRHRGAPRRPPRRCYGQPGRLLNPLIYLIH